MDGSVFLKEISCKGPTMPSPKAETAPSWLRRIQRGRRLAGRAAVLSAAVFLPLACSSTNGVVGSSGPHVPQFGGNYAAYLRPTATPHELEDLEAQVRSVAGDALSRLFTVGGVLVVALDQGTSGKRDAQVFSTLKGSQAVDHVEDGGCDIRMNSCEQWVSTAT